MTKILQIDSSINQGETAVPVLSFEDQTLWELYVHDILANVEKVTSFLSLICRPCAFNLHVNVHDYLENLKVL